jgi:hypothetical protein
MISPSLLVQYANANESEPPTEERSQSSIAVGFVRNSVTFSCASLPKGPASCISIAKSSVATGKGAFCVYKPTYRIGSTSAGSWDPYNIGS